MNVGSVCCCFFGSWAGFGHCSGHAIFMCFFGVPLGVPPWSLFLSKNYRDFEASSLEILVFRGTFRPI